MGFAVWGSHRSLKESVALRFGHVDMKAVASSGFMAMLVDHWSVHYIGLNDIS